MAAVTFADSIWTTTAGNKTTAAGNVPAVGDFVVVIAGSSGATTTAVTDSQGGTYVQADTTRTGFSTTGSLTVWVRTSFIAAASATNYTATQAGSTGGGLAALRVSGMTWAGANAVRGTGGQSTGTSGTTPAPVLSSTPLTTNVVIGAVANGTNPAGLTPRSSPAYTEHADSGYNTPATGLEVMSVDSGETSATITWGGTSPSAFASVAIELDTSAPASALVDAFQARPQFETRLIRPSATPMQLLGDREPTSAPPPTGTAEVGIATLGLAAAASPVKAAKVTGVTALSLAGTRSGAVARAQGGTSALGLVSAATARKTAVQAGTDAVGLAGSSAVRKVAAQAGTSMLGLVGSETAGPRAADANQARPQPAPMFFNPAAAALQLAGATQSAAPLLPVAGRGTIGLASTSATTIGGAGPTSPIYETFDSYPTGSAWVDGSTHGGWYVRFAGGGTIIPVDEPTRRVLQLESVTGLSDPGGTETAASLVTSTVSTTGDITLRARVRTVAQLRSGYSPPNTPNGWETAWLGWNYTEPSSGVRRFYYVALKTNGIELGKVDQSIALPGGQRFLFTDSTPFPLLSWCDVLVWQVGAQIQVWINGALRVNFTDGPGSLGTPNWGTSGETVLTTGAAALYQEDARAQFDHVALAGTTTATNVTGATTLGLAGAATPRKVAKSGGAMTAGLTGAAAERKVAVTRGAAAVGLVGLHSGTQGRAVGGTCTLGGAGTSTPRKRAVEDGAAAVGGAATSTPRKVAAGRGTVILGLASTAAAGHLARVNGTTALGLTGTNYHTTSDVPGGLTATPVSTTQIDLSWTSVSGASGYDIERNGVIITLDVIGTNFSDTGLNPATTYTYRVRSVHA